MLLICCVNEHLTGLLVGHKLADLVEQECSQEEEETCGEGGTHIGWFCKALWQVFVEVECFEASATLSFFLDSSHIDGRFDIYNNLQNKSWPWGFGVFDGF